jgi:hypothetical protein
MFTVSTAPVSDLYLGLDTAKGSFERLRDRASKINAVTGYKNGISLKSSLIKDSQAINHACCL